MQTFKYDKPFALEGGAVLPSLTIAYDTFGTRAPDDSNIIWVCHALTASSDVSDWWQHTVEEGQFLDPAKWFTVCANFLGSCYGTTGPSEINPATGEPWYGDFPQFTVRDMVRAHQLLAQHLGIKHVKMMVGSSIGGFQTMEWAISEPDFAENIALIATSVRSKPWAVAFDETQRMAMELDPTWGERTPEAGLNGMAAARAIALLSYRGGKAYDATQDEITDRLTDYRASSYQRYQGEKLRRRFNAYSYYRISQAVDSHNIGRGRGGVENALRQIKARTLIVAITSDILFTPAEHDVMRENIAHNEYHLIDSAFGHDGFLVEHEQLNAIIAKFLK